MPKASAEGSGVREGAPWRASGEARLRRSHLGRGWGKGRSTPCGVLGTRVHDRGAARTRPCWRGQCECGESEVKVGNQVSEGAFVKVKGWNTKASDHGTFYVLLRTWASGPGAGQAVGLALFLWCRAQVSTGRLHRLPEVVITGHCWASEQKPGN